MKKICFICISLLVLSLFISCETPTSSTTAKTTASTHQSTTVVSSGATIDSTSNTVSTDNTDTTSGAGGTGGIVTTATEENLFDKVKGQTYFGIRTWTEDEAKKLFEANEPYLDDLCEELADRRLALVFSEDGQKAGFADEDDQATANANAKSNQGYNVTQDGNKITIENGTDKLVLGIHDNGKFLYILEDGTQKTKPKEVTNANLDYNSTGLAKDGQENPKQKTSSSDWCPVDPKIPKFPAEFKKSS